VATVPVSLSDPRTGEGDLPWHPDVSIVAESSYAFTYQTEKVPGRWYRRLGARQSSTAMEVSTPAWQPLEEDDDPAAVDAATAVIHQALR
jgi:hypothetical protein